MHVIMCVCTRNYVCMELCMHVIMCVCEVHMYKYIIMAIGSPFDCMLQLHLYCITIFRHIAVLFLDV